MSYILAAALVLVDQISKIWISTHLALHQSWPVIPGIEFYHTVNDGIAFSLLSGVSGLGIISMIGAAYFAYLLRSNPPVLLRWAYTLILAGSLGNGIDRLTTGYVVDFIHLYYQNWHWAIFNFADSFICIGVALWLFSEFRSPQSSL